MELKTAGAFAVTTIHDRSGRRVGSYLVDKSKDSLNREQQNKRDRQQAPEEEQAVVFHNSEAVEVEKRQDGDAGKASEVAGLNLTV